MSAQLIQGDQRLLQVYYLIPAAQQGVAAANVQLPAGATLTVAGKLANALDAATVLFAATEFVQLQDAGSLYFAQAFLDLDTQEIADAFSNAGNGQNTLACLVDVIVNVPAQAAAGLVPAVPASRATFQIPVSLKAQVYSGNEADPQPATPPYPAIASVTAAIAQAGGVATAIVALANGQPMQAVTTIYAAIAWANPSRTLAAGVPATPTTDAQQYAADIWAAAARTLTS